MSSEDFKSFIVTDPDIVDEGIDISGIKRTTDTSPLLLGDLEPGQGYQILMRDEVDDFMFTNTNGLRIELNETIPQWVNDLPLIHPNDIKTLVKVINTLGQEVNPETQISGTVLIYLYNDGSVEKKMLK